MWEVVLWFGGRATRWEFKSREAAYQWANGRPNAEAVEVYGPGGYYDAAS